MTNKGFYKGTGSGSMGDHTKHGGYIINWDKVRTYVVPDGLDQFPVSNLVCEAWSYEIYRLLCIADKLFLPSQLTPFVTKKVDVPMGRFEGDPKGPLSGELYLKRWERENGHN
jgi:large subunit ribosomal protein L41